MKEEHVKLSEEDRGGTFTEVATTVAVTQQTASTWAKKYQETDLAMLTDKPRPDRPTIIDGLQRAKITALACSDPPEGYARWSLRLLAEKAIELEYVEAISYGEVRRTLRKSNSSPT